MADATRMTGAPGAAVRVSLRSALAVVVAIALTILALEVALDAKRVIAWAVSAMAVAALVQPAVTYLARWIPRGLAVVCVVVLLLGSIGYVAYRIVDDVSDETKRLQRLAPERAAELERDSELLHEIELTERVERFVDAIPERLRGGTTAEAIRSAANRGLAFIAGVVLTLFFVLSGPTLVGGALGQIRDARRRARIDQVVRGASARGLGYARVKTLEVVVEGVLAFTIARIADIPGPAAFGVWVALWTFIPIAGLAIGALPIVVFAAADSARTAWFVALAFVAVAVGEWFVTRRLERHTLHVGPYLTALALFAGLELYGFMGALLLLLGVVLAVAVVCELNPELEREAEPAEPSAAASPVG
ncbi:MAG: AI-2E family transporter [Actinomycetota bacterium]